MENPEREEQQLRERSCKSGNPNFKEDGDREEQDRKDREE